jgi:hypothetical protein
VRAAGDELYAADLRIMTDVEQIWRDKADEEIAEAAGTLSEYTEEAARIIRAELQRRGLPEPEADPLPIPDEDTRSVFVASGLDEANQIVAFLKAAGIESALRGESTTKTHGFTVDGLGRLEILVRESDQENARALFTSANAGEFQLGEDEDVES